MFMSEVFILLMFRVSKYEAIAASEGFGGGTSGPTSHVGCPIHPSLSQCVSAFWGVGRAPHRDPKVNLRQPNVLCFELRFHTAQAKTAERKGLSIPIPTIFTFTCYSLVPSHDTTNTLLFLVPSFSNPPS